VILEYTPLKILRFALNDSFFIFHVFLATDKHRFSQMVLHINIGVGMGIALKLTPPHIPLEPLIMELGKLPEDVNRNDTSGRTISSNLTIFTLSAVEG
jgi:hypothetical protein